MSLCRGRAADSFHKHTSTAGGTFRYGKYLLAKGARQNHFEYCYGGALGCLLAHRNAWEQVVRRPETYGVVLENNAVVEDLGILQALHRSCLTHGTPPVPRGISLAASYVIALMRDTRSCRYRLPRGP